MAEATATRVRSSSIKSEAEFRARLAELGAILLEPYGGSKHPHRAQCAAGHQCTPRPNDIQQGVGVCRVCSGLDPATAEAAFRARLAELGAVLLEPRWLGSLVPHRVRCAAGHESAPAPHAIQRGQGICRACVGHDPATAEAAFRNLMAMLGAMILEPYKSTHAPIRIRCAAGHVSSPRPGDVLGGTGACRSCAGKLWDAFYVVADLEADRIKFGITSGDPRPRLGDHRRDGYLTSVRLLTGLPGDVAPGIERAALAALDLAGIKPIRGREYYDASALAVVLDIADNYPTRPDHTESPMRHTRHTQASA